MSDHTEFSHDELTTAADLFVSNHFANTSQAALAEALGRDGIPPLRILQEIFAAPWRLITTNAKSRINRGGDVRDVVSDIFTDMFRIFLVDERSLGRCISIECHRYDRAKLQACFLIPEVTEFLHVLRDYLDGYVRAGSLVGINTDSLLELLLSIQDGMMFAWIIQDDFSWSTRFSLDDFSRVTRMLVAALLVSPAEQSKQYYDLLADTYDDLYTDSVSESENHIVATILESEITAGDTIVDLGCGSGLAYQLLSELCKKDFKYIGVDISSEMIHKANRKFGLALNASFHVMNIEDMSFLDNESADLVTSLFGSFSHAVHYSVAVSELKRILKPGGKILLMVYSRFSLRNVLRALRKLQPNLLAEVHEYEIRRTSGSIFADARFYYPKLIKRAFADFDNLQVRGLNCAFELPLINTYFAHPKKRAVTERLLRLEMRSLATVPYLCHSLIITGTRR